MEDLLPLVPLIVLSLATYRLTRFFLFDSLLFEPRERLRIWLLQRGRLVYAKLYDLVSCSWCFGFWVALVAYSLYIWDNPFDFDQHDWINVFAVAGFAGLLHAFEPSEDDE